MVTKCVSTAVCERLLVQQITFSVESQKNLKTVRVRAENVCFQCFVSCLNAEAVFSEIFTPPTKTVGVAKTSLSRGHVIWVF